MKIKSEKELEEAIKPLVVRAGIAGFILHEKCQVPTLSGMLRYRIWKKGIHSWNYLLCVPIESLSYNRYYGVDFHIDLSVFGFGFSTMIDYPSMIAYGPIEYRKEENIIVVKDSVLTGERVIKI